MATLKHAVRAACLAAALAAMPLAAAQAAGTLTVAQAQDPGSWDPIATFLVDWSKVANNVFDGLIERSPDLKLRPALATSWEILDNNARIRFHLRRNVQFHDGEVFNAAAVKFTFDRLLGPEGAKGPQQSNYNAISTVDVVDDYTVDFHLKRPDPVLLTKLAGYGAMIVPPKYIQEKGAAYFATHPVGTGPFKMAEYKPKVSVTLEAFDHFWGGKPKLDRVVYRFITEGATQVAELQSGNIDIITFVPLSLISTIKKDPKLEVVSVDGPTANVLFFNIKHGITANENVRKAMILAVDRANIVKTILQGQATPIASFQGSLSFGYDPAQAVVPYDPAKARAMLKAAGVKPGAAVQLDFRGNDATFREVAQAVAGYLQAVGIKVNIKPYEDNVFLNDIIPNGRTGEMFQMRWGGWTFDFDNTAYLMYHSGEKWNPYIKDNTLDQMLEAQRGTYDEARRLTLLRKVAAYVAEHALEMPLYNVKTIYGVNKRVRNFVAPADNRFRFTDVTVD